MYFKRELSKKGGYGNVQFTCACGKVLGTEYKYAEHIASMSHLSGKVYYQQVKGKLSQGKCIGNVTATRTKDKSGMVTVKIKYPNDRICAPYGFAKGTY